MKRMFVTAGLTSATGGVFLAGVSLTLAASAFQLPLPTPDRSKWEITFVEFEEAIGLRSLTGAPAGTEEMRIMHRPAALPNDYLFPFLRVFRADGGVRAEFLVVWMQGPNRFPVDRPTTRCSPPGPRGICVRQVEMTEGPDWSALLSVQTTLCTPRQGVCADCPSLLVKMLRDARYREGHCNGVASGTPDGDLYELMARETAAIVARW